MTSSSSAATARSAAPTRNSASIRCSCSCPYSSSSRAIAADAHSWSATASNGRPRHSRRASSYRSRARVGIPGGQQPVSLFGELGEPERVHVVGVDDQSVATGVVDEIHGLLPPTALRLERLPQPPDVRFQGGLDRQRIHLAPDRIDQCIDRDPPVGVDQQNRQHQARLGVAERVGDTRDLDHQGPQVVDAETGGVDWITIRPESHGRGGHLAEFIGPARGRACWWAGCV